MLRVALTGGIATGKSYVLARVAARGVPTLDSDRVVHALMAPHTPVTAAIAARFGRAFLDDDGAVNRRALGRLVFADGTAREALEQIVHPAVYGRIDTWARQEAQRGAPWVLVDVPLLYETHHEGDFDRVVVAACDPAVQVQRIVARDGLAEAEAHARVAAQWPIGEKVKRADYLIATGGTFEETDRQVDEVVGQIESTAAEG